MTLTPISSLPQVSNHARYLFGFIIRRGGTMRIGPLMRHVGMERPQLAEAIDELAEFYWIRVTQRVTRPDTGELQVRPLEEIERLTATRFGRRKYRTTWPSY